MRSLCCAGLWACMLVSFAGHAQSGPAQSGHAQSGPAQSGPAQPGPAQPNPPLLSPEEEAPRHYPISVFVQLPWGHWVSGKKILAEGAGGAEGAAGAGEAPPDAAPAYVRRRAFPFSLGIRGDIVILDRGFAPTVDDQFGLSIGVDIGEIAKGLWISTPAEFWWRLFLRHRLAAYAKLGLGVGWVIVGHQEKTNVEFFPVATLGFEYRLSHILSCRFEAGFPWLRMGLAF